VIPLKSFTTFLIRAWVIISWPFRMPPSMSPVTISTIAISSRVNPACLAFDCTVSPVFAGHPRQADWAKIGASAVPAPVSIRDRGHRAGARRRLGAPPRGVQEVLKASSEPIHGPRAERVVAALYGLRQGFVEARALVASLGAAEPAVAVYTYTTSQPLAWATSRSSRSWFVTGVRCWAS